MLILIVHGQGNYNDIVGTQTKYPLVIYNQYVLRSIYTCISLRITVVTKIDVLVLVVHL